MLLIFRNVLATLAWPLGQVPSTVTVATGVSSLPAVTLVAVVVAVSVSVPGLVTVALGGG
jgi:hypothetical protein